MNATIAPAARFTALFATDDDARRFTRAGLLCNATAYAHLFAAAAGWLPAWSLLLTMPVLVPRWMIAVHELFHLRSQREVDAVTRLLPFLFTFLGVGYRELLVNHRSHHRHMATPRDAEYFQLRGSPLAGLLNAFTAPEQIWFRWVAEHGIDGELARATLLRLALFLALIGSTGAAFLWYWVPARVAFGLGYFVFFYCLHRRGEDYGVYPLVLPRALQRAATLAWGRDVVEATLHHDVHHAQPRIAAACLAGARAAVLAKEAPGNSGRTGSWQAGEVRGGEMAKTGRARRWAALWWVIGVLGAIVLAVGGAAVLPAPAEPVHLHNEVVIARAPQEVFDFVTTPGNWPKWHPSSLGVSGATDHPLLVGEQATEDFLVAGRRGRALWTVTQREAPRRWQIEGGGEEGGKAWITYTLTEQAGATRFERDMRYRMPNLLAALLDPLLTRSKIAAESAQAVQQLKQVLERGK